MKAGVLVEDRNQDDAAVSPSPPTSRSLGKKREYDDFKHQPLSFDTPAAPNVRKEGEEIDPSDNSEGMYENDRQRQWEHLRAEWRAGWEATSINHDSRRGSARTHPHVNNNVKTPANVPRSRRRVASSDDCQLRYTRQRAPFHTSQVGKLATRSPLSIGLFKPGYPYVPSGQRRRSAAFNGSLQYPDLPLKSTFSSDYTPIPPFTHTNILKHGWTKSVLDDDTRLSIPDESRKSRDAKALTSLVWGKKWYRWKAGEGYVWSRSKDLSVYRHGPGFALGQLLPPRERPRTATLPFIPNDSKRDLVWLLVFSFAFFSLVACVQEYRWRARADRKGKKRNRSSLSDVDISRSTSPSLLRLTKARTTSLSHSSPTSTRQRLRAHNFRDLCRVALLKGVTGLGMTASNRSTGLANIRWTSRHHRSSNEYVKHNIAADGLVRDASEGSIIELLEKGGVDGSQIISPVLDKGQGPFLTKITTTVYEDFSLHGEGRGQQSGQTSKSD
ncbi:hypothetical protein CBS101457_004363 [Exobasidium rhododendri]|nr:hypothetical protein CBS101457_004363 [Exobasidium rhododendri]